MPLTQRERIMAIATPLGEDKLLLQRLRGREELGRLFSFDLRLLSEDGAIDFDKIVGENVSIRLNLPNGGVRWFNGFVSEFAQGVSESGFAEYHATVVPALWFLTRTSDCRIFQNQKVPDILAEIFDKHGYADIEDTLDISNYRTREYCVQYRETDFAFVSRLMEQEGIYYYFKHADGKHTLVLCDSLSKHEPFEGYATIVYRPPGEKSVLEEHISEWTIRGAVQPGSFAHTDYNFKKPKTQLLNPASKPGKHARADYEIFDFPGNFTENDEGKQYAKIRMEEIRARHETLTGKADARGIVPGFKFKLDGHPRDDQNREYLVTSAEYEVTASGYESGRDQAREEPVFTCTFTALDAQTQFRTERTTPRPVIRGTQTAVVVGPSGEEIYPDEFGRVKVHFHWDRHNAPDENASCWIRVSQVHAGKSFGGIDLPRIGEEVVVGYLEGDPDQPLIIGRVYNAEQKVPFALPGAMVVSGMKSNSTKGGGGYNEFTLDDTKGKEKITVHGQYDMNTTVEHDQTNTVHNDRTQIVDNNDSLTVTKGNRTITVQTGTNTETIKGDSTLTVQAGKRAVSVTGGDYSVTCSDAVLLEGQSKGVQIIGTSQGVGIKGTGQGVNVNGTDQGVTIKGSGGPGVSINGDPNVEISGKSKVAITAPTVDIGDKAIAIHGTKIEISTAGGSIVLDAAGVTITGNLIKSEAKGIHDIKGAMVKLNA